ncbi:hypothetical protein DMA11_03565 [Marinilabiliaceae bacterium JC017]|nr:hypothetical protein DMA11_03565 [Marinilabiliaceae bacterium JC017]
MVTLLALNGCQKVPTETAFYHWEQTVDLQEPELTLLEQVKATNLYLRIFDIDYKDKSKAPAFLSLVNVKQIPPAEYNLIPCIFITNRSFKGVNYPLTDSLARRTASQIRHLQKKNKLSFGDEIQIDCDWTPSTRNYYFAFLKYLRDYLPEFTTLSATIRLHQYKYPKKTGVPPIDKGSLMLYNMGNFEKPDAKNAIYDNAILKQYLSKTQQYPLHLDIAMPVFNWALVFRFGKAVKIIHNPRITDLKENKDFFAHQEDNRYKVLHNGYWQGLYLYKGDILRLDQVKAEDIEKGLELVKKQSNIEPQRIIYYHLFEEITEIYSYENFKKFSTVFN